VKEARVNPAFIMNPQELPQPIRTIEEAEANRKHGCVAYDDCLSLADEKGWKSFSCAQCPGEIVGKTTKMPDNAKRRLVSAIVVQALMDIEKYAKLVEKLGHEPRPPFEGPMRKIVTDCDASRAFFYIPYKSEDGEWFKSYCDYLLSSVDAGCAAMIPILKQYEGTRREA
jgi:hypothetical protein